MKKIIIVFYLFLLPFAFVYPQTEVKLDCDMNLENIHKIHDKENVKEAWLVRKAYQRRNL